MSVRCISQVLEKSVHAGTDLLMLIVLADYSDDEGNSYPAVASLARKCRMKSRNAIYILKALQASGELRILKNEGPKGCNRYRIMLATLGAIPLQPIAPLQRVAPLQSMVGGGAIHGNKPLQPIAPEPSLNRQEPSVALDSDFQEIPKKPTRKKSQQPFKIWYEAAKAISDKVIPEDDPIMAYAKTVGLDIDFLRLHFAWFKEKYTNDPKLQADWLKTFRNSVKGNWGRLWFRTTNGAWELTTTGKQAALEHGFDENLGVRQAWGNYC